MDVLGLMNGIGVIIDDEIFDTDANIQGIVKQIEKLSIPLVKYSSTPSDEVISNIQDVSFLILDWRLIKGSIDDSDISQGVVIPDELQEDNALANLEFLEKVVSQCYNPIFIFTNETAENIKDQVYEKFGFSEDKPNNFFIHSKVDLMNEGEFVSKISEWIEKNPSIYVLKQWEKEYRKGKYQLFTDFYKINELWPNVIWKTFTEDGGNVSQDLNEFIYRNLYSRIAPYTFDDKVLNPAGAPVPTKSELRTVLEGERFLKNERLDFKEIKTGDIFLVHKDDGNDEYWLNIRAQCDLVRHKEGNPELYLIKGSVLIQNDNGKIKDVSFNKGEYIEKANQSIVPFIDGGKILEFLYRDLTIMKWNDIKDKRVGRLLPPYITKIQQKYALYMQRQGLPKIPDEAI